MKKFLTVISSLFLLFSPAPAAAQRIDKVPPTMDLSAVRYIICTTSDGDEYSGSGYLIGPKIMATAFHVAEGGWMTMPKKDPVCYDIATQTRVVTYKLDIKHDFALMTGVGLPTNIPYLKYNCSRPIPGHAYTSYGVTDYGQPAPIFRTNVIIATDKFSTADNKDTWVENMPSPGLRIYQGVIAPGMSGGPVADLLGNIVSFNSAGDDKTTDNFDLADTPLCDYHAQAA